MFGFLFIEKCRYCGKAITNKQENYSCISWTVDEMWISKDENEGSQKFHAECVKEKEEFFKPINWDLNGHQCL